MNRLTLMTACATTLVASTTFAADDPALRDGDPKRWDEPIATPAQRLMNSSKEARNAMAEALKECRSSAQRKSCEVEARAQYDRDIAAARKEARESRNP